MVQPSIGGRRSEGPVEDSEGVTDTHRVGAPSARDNSAGLPHMREPRYGQPGSGPKLRRAAVRSPASTNFGWRIKGGLPR